MRVKTGGNYKPRTAIMVVKEHVSFLSTTKTRHIYHVQTQVSMVELVGVLGITIISKIGGVIVPHRALSVRKISGVIMKKYF